VALTPVEIRHVRLGRGPLGYRRAATEQLLEEIAASYEDVWRERADLADEVERLEADLVRFRELEALLRTTLVSAERASAEMKEQARREADVILAEAHAEARAVSRRSVAEHERLSAESRRIRERLRLALATLGELDDDESTAGGSARPAAEAA
jgi:cell division initiation protein